MKRTMSPVTYDVERLASGVRLVVGRLPHMASVAVGVWARVGGRYESAKKSGISHFLEHLVFKGTRRRSCEALKQAIEGYGGALNGFTGEELTCYLAKVLKPHVPRAVDVLTDMLLRPRLDAVDVEKERKVILEEIRMYHDQPAQHVHELTNTLLWPDHPLGRPIAGTPGSMANITRQELRAHQTRYYAPRNLTVVMAGDVTLREAKLALASLGRRSRASAAAAPLPAPRRLTAQRLRWEHRETEQTHVCLATHAVGRRHRMRYAVNLLHVILGANMSSRLFREVREKRALAYEIGSHIKHLSDTGGFIVSLGCEPRNLVEAVTVIVNELRRVAAHSVSAAELRRAKEFYRGQLLMALEDTMEHMLWVGEAFVCDRRVPDVAKLLHTLERVDDDDIRHAARHLFHPERLHLAIVGPHQSDEERTLQQLLHTNHQARRTS